MKAEEKQMGLKISSPSAEGVLRVSKWLKYQLLIDEEEMEALLGALSPLWIYIVSEPVEARNHCIETSDFLSLYRTYVKALKEGDLLEENKLRRVFSSIFTTTPDVVYAMPIKEDSFLIKPLKPVIQLQAHHFFFSQLDNKIHPMVLSPDSISWGIQFSYPQIFQDPKTHQFSKVAASEEFPNTALFMRLVKWIRSSTSATPFIINHVKTYVPIRLGKRCFSWIARHPQLSEKGLEIAAPGSFL